MIAVSEAEENHVWGTIVGQTEDNLLSNLLCYLGDGHTGQMLSI